MVSILFSLNFFGLFSYINSFASINQRQSHYFRSFSDTPQKQQQQNQKNLKQLLFATTKENDDINNRNNDIINTDRRNVLIHISSCIGLANVLCASEDFLTLNARTPQTSNFQPNLHRGSTRGMGYGLQDRFSFYDDNEEELQQQQKDLSDIPSYNELMLQHRTEKVPKWRKYYNSPDDSKNSDDIMSVAMNDQELKKAYITNSTVSLYEAIYTLNDLKKLTEEYEWDQMFTILNQPKLTTNLEDACTILRYSLVSSEGKLSSSSSEASQEIGFPWGSCAWRHCGALADAQESIAELRNALGLYEPFECLFCIDIVERSIRDIIAYVPQKFKPSDMKLPDYVAYIPTNGDYGDGYTGFEEEDENALDDNSVGKDFFAVLNQLKNTYADDDDD